MKYRAYATRTKSDGKEVIVEESVSPIDTKRLKEGLLSRSEEFDELTKIRIVEIK